MKAIALSWIKRRFLLPIVKAIKEGISVQSLSVSLALGFTIGIIPVFGVQTFVAAFIALSLRLNVIAMQIAVYAVTPFQFALLAPFFKIGHILFKSGAVSMSFYEQMQLFRANFWDGLHNFFLLNIAAICIWLILSIPLYFGLYYGLAWLIRKHLLTRIKVLG